VADWLDHPGRNLWADVVWKLLCIELWAQRMLDDGRPERTAPTPPPSVGAVAVDRTRPQGAALAERGGWRNRLQELRELGPGGLRFRVGWEARTRTGLAEWLERPPPPLLPGQHPTALELAARLPFDAPAVATAMTKRLGLPERHRLVSVAEVATRGKILAFGRWFADYGVETDWHLNPVNGRRWNPERHWSRVLSEERRVGDIKLTWEIGRFPHAYFMARAATHVPEKAPALAASMAGQIRRFAEANPFALGAHWASGQEIVFRLMGWLFALGAMGPKSALAEAAPEIARALHLGAIHVERHLDYTLKAVYNNHLLSEAFGLLLAGELLPAAPEAARWRVRGLEILGDQAGRQFYEDGAYIQQSHNYERVALQVYLWAVALLRQKGDPVPPPWLAALDRATTFLHANQNPADGRLPNYGANDGALVSPFTSCDYSDFRPVLQAASVAARGERLYEPGPWDEETAWLLGPASLEAPLLSRPRRSVSFVPTGFHVLRGKDESSFAAFRCGTVRDRFSQIDMLSLDVWWRGENVLVDPGSYLYNGPARWHDHFMCTGSHNTVTVDGRDQMLHYRRFKNLYWTEARLLGFEDHGEYVLAQGEHHGYRRHPGGCVHRRGVLLARDDLWVVLDQVSGEGSHACRLHWLAGEYPYAYDPEGGRLSLTTPAGEFSVITLNEQGAPLVGDVAAGRSGPPSGWLSRYYGEKRAVPSLAIELAGMVPLTVVSILSGGCPEVAVQEGCWTVRLREVALRFAVADGRFKDVRVERTSARSDLA
jgi:asparagine synthase (glutamine-hydrolysing)